MMEPRSTSVGSNMPAYPHLFTDKFDQKTLPKKVAVMTRLGVPYPAMTADEIKMQALEQAVKIAEELKAQGKVAAPDTQIVALIAYLQKLGKFDTPEVEQKLSPQGVPFPLQPALPDSHRKTVSQHP